tara:strand:- start:1588 stop:2175 length:588 start_codon:yes stop_codon:yes gene_type:complete
MSISVDNTVNPDLAFFSILLKGKTKFLSIAIIILAISLTISTIDTLVNAISSIVFIDGNKIYSTSNRSDFLRISKVFIVILCIISLFIASKGYSILYLFLLADLLCCAAVFTVFYGFYKKKFKEKNAIISIISGLFLGLLLFPSPDFSKSILIGTLLPFDLFPQILSSSLLFWSFLLAAISPTIVTISYDSFKRR